MSSFETILRTEACPTFLMILGCYFAPDFRGGAKNKKFVCINLIQNRRKGVSIQPVALACTCAL